MSGITIVEFLQARISEDEALAEKASVSMHGERHDSPYSYGDYILSSERDSTAEQDQFVMQWWPVRVLAECAAKRAVIALAEEATSLDMLVDHDRRIGARDMAKEPYCGDLILKALTAAYKDHPDYDPAWGVK